MEIITTNLDLTIYGFSGTAVNKDYPGTAFKLLDKMWKIVKPNNVKNKGLNVIVYDENENVFAGVELENPSGDNFGLEKKDISLIKYAYYKHIGSYDLIKRAGYEMRTEIKSKGFEHILPYIEIYGHWTDDHTKLETELLMCLK